MPMGNREIPILFDTISKIRRHSWFPDSPTIKYLSYLIKNFIGAQLKGAVQKVGSYHNPMELDLK